MGEAPAEPIQLPAHDEIHLAAFGVGHELVERGSTILRTADARINVFGGLPATSLAVTPKLQELVFACLIAGRDAGVDGRTSRCSHVVSVLPPIRGKAIGDPMGAAAKIGATTRSRMN